MFKKNTNKDAKICFTKTQINDLQLSKSEPKVKLLLYLYPLLLDSELANYYVFGPFAFQVFSTWFHRHSGTQAFNIVIDNTPDYWKSESKMPLHTLIIKPVGLKLLTFCPTSVCQY